MTTEDVPSLPSLRQCHDFVALHAPELGIVTQTTAWRSFDDALRHVDRALELKRSVVANREDVDRSLSTTRLCLLLDAIHPAIRVAHAVRRDNPDVPALAPPPPDASIVELIDAGHDIADVVTRHQCDFDRCGLPRHVAEELRGLPPLLEWVAECCAATDQNLVRATLIVEARLERAGEAARQLDAVVVEELADSPRLLATWKRVRLASPRAA